ncbi:sensor histidine kinase [Treponema sp.]|uniref:sensor histidine kinase n=1 Tax=Treponema sp. TaxID=166 RepID=UPI003F0A66EF
MQTTLAPFIYYNKEIENQFDALSKIIKSNGCENDILFFAKSIELENLIRLNQKAVNSGYNCLFIPSFFTFIISILLILYKTFCRKNELLRQESLNSAKLKFSQDLHEGVAQYLAALKLFIKNGENEKAAFYSDLAFKEVRYLIDSNRLDFTQDFEENLRQTLKSFEINFEIKTEFLCASNHIKNFNQETQMELLRIFQEALSNCARHSNASLLTVKITDICSSVRFIIQDNGRGFTEEELAGKTTEEKNHYGLKNICSRVESLGGDIEISGKGGTTIAVTLKNIVC